MAHCPTYRDLDPKQWSQAGTYRVQNESQKTFNDAIQSTLGDRRFERGACITSSGETMMSVLLPRCGEVIGIDCNYTCLDIAYKRFVLFQQVAPKQFIDTKDEYVGAALFNRHMKTVASPISQDHAWEMSYADMNWIRTHWPAAGLQEVIPEEEAKKVSYLLHGDVRQLQEYGPFDILYISNAMQYGGMDSKFWKLEDVAPLVRVGGVILFTGMISPFPSQFQPRYSSQGYAWVYNIVERIE